jgi:hypothetical protein
MMLEPKVSGVSSLAAFGSGRQTVYADIKL